MTAEEFIRLVFSLDVSFEHHIRDLNRHFARPAEPLKDATLLGRLINDQEADSKEALVHALRRHTIELAEEVRLHAGPFFNKTFRFFDLEVPLDFAGDVQRSNYLRVVRVYDFKTNSHLWRIECLFKAT